MLKRFVVLGIVLSLAGSAAIGLVLADKRKEQRQIASYKLKYDSEPNKYLRQYDQWSQLPPRGQAYLSLDLDKHNENKTEAQLLQEQQERFKADLDKLATGQMNAHPFADILYGENWQEKLSKYKKQKESKEFILTSSIVCASIGGAILTWCLLLLLARLLIKGFAGMSSFFADVLRRRKENKDKQPQDSFQEGEKESGQEPNSRQSQLDKNSTVLTNSGWYDFDTDLPNQQPSPPQKIYSMSREPGFANASTAATLSDEKTVESEKSLTTATESLSTNTLQSNSTQTAQKTALLDSEENLLEPEDSLKAQTENLEKQIAEFRQMAQSVQQSTLKHSKPLNNTLKELTQQMSAIRQYASHQQDKMEKLQDGYDWNIIRTFCLRIIRCIDNLENRIRQLTEQNIETVQLEEVRDELLFALESSGIEQFEPEVNSNYRGQEKYAEAVKEKQHCDDQNLTGKIAEVIRAGYQYLINEEDVKIVRAARVKLFG